MKRTKLINHVFKTEDFLDKLGINGDHVVRVGRFLNHWNSDPPNIHIEILEEVQSSTESATPEEEK